MLFQRALVASTLALAAAVAVSTTLLATTAFAAPPSPCGGVEHASDPSGDGHHPDTDVLAAWWSEPAPGQLQASIRMSSTHWYPVHDDEEVDGAGYAVVFRIGETTWFVRLFAPPVGPLQYQYGTWSPTTWFTVLGTTTGTAENGVGGVATIDVPGAITRSDGTILRELRVLTYDGESGGTPHWVDRAPGGTDPSGTSFGADFVVGTCTRTTGGAGADPTVPPRTTSVSIDAPDRILGARAVVITGSVAPARAGVWVTIARTTHHGTIRKRGRTRTDGTFRWTLPLIERTSVRATADGLGSQERTIEVGSTVRLFAHRRGSRTVLVGRTSPPIPGQVLLLPTDDVEPAMRTRAVAGKFVLRPRRLASGSYQAVFIPASGRAERATSNTVRVG